MNNTYKSSTFNSILHIDNRHSLIFNSLTGKYIIIKNRLIPKTNDSILQLAKDNNYIDTTFKEEGIIVNENINEVEIVKNLISETDNNPTIFLLNINPTLDCNFNCWYCYEKHQRGSKMSQETIDNICLYISKRLSEKPQIQDFDLGFFGGEPLLYFDEVAKKIILFTSGKCEEHNIRLKINFTSNGYLITDEIIDFLKSYSTSFQITLDGYKEIHDKTRFLKSGMPSYETIAANIRKLIENDIFVNIRINYTSQNINSISNIVNSFSDIPKSKRHLFRFDFHRVWQQHSNKDDETEVSIMDVREHFKNCGFDVIENAYSNVTLSCYGDKINHNLINYNGDVYGCTARDFTEDNCIGHLTNQGIIDYRQPDYNMRHHSKFNREICQQCRIAPLCGGGCKQRAFEASNIKGCINGYDEEDIDNLIMKIFCQKFC